MGQRERLTILLVEDDPSLRWVARLILEQDGHEVLEAAHAAEALAVDAAHGDRIQVVVTDNAMPGTWGVELLERLRTMRRGLGAVVISGLPDEGAADGVVWLLKPFSAEQLGSAVLAARSRFTSRRNASAPEPGA